ncbi:MAG: DNA polymerase III subunit delta [Chloroflexota bacterium]
MDPRLRGDNTVSLLMFYLFHGDDAHSQKETLVKLTKRMGDPSMLDLNTTRFEGKVTFSEIRQACSAMPFLAPVRLVLVQDFFKNKPDKAVVKELTAYLPEMPNTARLVFLESDSLRDNHALVKLANTADNGYVKRFSRPEGAGLDRWIRQKVESENGRIAPQAVHLLATNVGNNLTTLNNELEKLLLYKGTEAMIEAADVTLLSPYAAESTIFDLVDALGNRNAKKASLLLQEKINGGTDPFYLFSMFVRQFRLLIQARELMDEGLRPPAISKRMKQHSFVVGKLYQQARGFHLKQLEQIYRHLLEIDVGVKTGKADMLTSLNLLVANLTVTS